MSTGQKIFTTSDLSKDSGELIAAALQAPVTITQRKKPRLVMMSIAAYETFRRRADTRIVGRTADMPAELAEEVLAAIDAHHEDAHQ
jgi:PHD/YefM family antitoxin component YafN of YafNO toxin-antitoxin module